ncbi:MAG: AAA family ATPase, partial [Candidatus Magasanikbacteria bacterium]|nr:AAA family ATPase [Candidatus Magasanikbacteria bacterium]
MFLKSLEIHGFKSFSEKTVLNFLPIREEHRSVTAIVGPNGSGKSNVADAIRWVMGEQSMKTLRGKKGEDVIFAGAEGKGKMGMARVDMTLDNQDHRMPLDYDEVVISRRMDRTGESEYTINGNPVRLFDLQVLLAQAQFGHGSYSVIGQGMIDRLLLQSPAERKDFFDEACGIKEFQIKRHSASLKLERTRAHMDEAELLLNEIRPRLKTLSRQVKKLEERQSIELSLREKQEQYYVTLYTSQHTILSTLRTEVANLQEKLNVSESNLRAIQESLATLAKETSRTSVFQELQRDYERIGEEKNRLELEQAQLATKLQTSYSVSGQQDLSWLIQKRESAKSGYDRLAREEEQIGAPYERAKNDLKNTEADYASLLSSRQEITSRIRLCEEIIARIKNESISMTRHEVRALDYILHDPMRYGTVYGTVADLADVAPEYALALDVATGAHGSSVIVESDTVAERWIKNLREERLGIATFLPLNTVKPRTLPADSAQLLSRPGVRGLAKDLLRYDPKFETVFSFLFGTTLIVESIDTARSVGIGRIRMVTMSGDVIETNGAMRGGFRERKNFSTGFSGGRRATRDLEEKEKAFETAQKELLSIESKIEEKSNILRETTRQFDSLENQLKMITERVREASREFKSLDDEYRLLTANPAEQSNIIEKLKQEHASISDKISELELDHVSAQAKLDNFQESEEQKKQRIFFLQDEMQSAQTAVNTLLAEKNTKAVEIARLETKQEDVVLEVATELRESIEIVIRRGVLPIGADIMGRQYEEIQKLKYALSLIGGIDEEVMQEFRETKERHDGLELQLTDLNKAFSDLSSLISELDEMMSKKRAETFRQIRKEFTRYFSVLFGGGKADIVEVIGDENAPDGETNGESQNGEQEQNESKNSSSRKQKIVIGIDVVANPPGKKISNIQSLSGGERTMTSLALLSAILHTNP